MRTVFDAFMMAFKEYNDMLYGHVEATDEAIEIARKGLDFATKDLYRYLSLRKKEAHEGCDQSL
jgi:multidrug resistance efflux pump